jgi:hypothetical protein
LLLPLPVLLLLLAAVTTASVHSQIGHDHNYCLAASGIPKAAAINGCVNKVHLQLRCLAQLHSHSQSRCWHLNWYYCCLDHWCYCCAAAVLLGPCACCCCRTRPILAAVHC